MYYIFLHNSLVHDIIQHFSSRNILYFGSMGVPSQPGFRNSKVLALVGFSFLYEPLSPNIHEVTTILKVYAKP